MCIVVCDLSYRYTNRQSLFEAIRFSVPPGGKAAIVGNNGTGKSTLLKLLAGELTPVSGSVACAACPCYVPQQPDLAGLSVAEALGAAEKIAALRAICAGSTDPVHYDTLGDDWEIEAKCRAALDGWGLHRVGTDTRAETLSGGERTKLLLAGASLRKPEILLLDEPTNHLDEEGRRQLCAFVRDTRATVVVVSHDITLLNLLETTYELSPLGLKRYGGNYDFYREQKRIERQALEQRIDAAQSALKQARRRAQEIRERQEKRAAQGERKKDQAPRILRKGLKDSGEWTASRLRNQHAEIIGRDSEKIAGLRARQQRECLLRIDFDDAQLHDGKLLAEFRGVDFAYPGGRPLWVEPLDAAIRSGERIRLRGGNGAGKTTLLSILTGLLKQRNGEITFDGRKLTPRQRRALSYLVMQDTDYQLFASSVEEELSLGIQEDCKEKVDAALEALELSEYREQHPAALSGGQKQRVTIGAAIVKDSPVIYFDEPTSGLDYDSMVRVSRLIEQLSASGVIVFVVSHDFEFIVRTCTEVVQLDDQGAVQNHRLTPQMLKALSEQYFH